MRTEFTKKFLKNLEIYGTAKKSLVENIFDLKKFFEQNGFDISLFNRYDIKNLGKNYFRIKFIPYRIILKIEKNSVEFVELFKRKGKSDYKKYN